MWCVCVCACAFHGVEVLAWTLRETGVRDDGTVWPPMEDPDLHAVTDGARRDEGDRIWTRLGMSKRQCQSYPNARESQSDRT